MRAGEFPKLRPAYPKVAIAFARWVPLTAEILETSE
jgi:hypothetical protein